jgi:predicted tellurium resistance membrane protein TerC
MKFLRFVARLFGWLLTPIVASAASFLGAVGGAMIARSVDNPTSGLITSGVCALVAAVLVTWLWLHWLRRRPEVRAALGVDETGAPEAFIPEIEEGGEGGEGGKGG